MSFGGNSKNDLSNLLVFEGKMDEPGFETMLIGFLLPFIAEKTPNFHMLYMDNAPQHTAAESINFLKIIT